MWAVALIGQKDAAVAAAILSALRARLCQRARTAATGPLKSQQSPHKDVRPHSFPVDAEGHFWSDCSRTCDESASCRRRALSAMHNMSESEIPLLCSVTLIILLRGP